MTAAIDPNGPSATLRTWLDQAQSQHADRPWAVAADLTARAATLPADSRPPRLSRTAQS